MRPVSPTCPFGVWLRDNMDLCGMTELDVAAKTGLSRSIISYHVHGRRHPDFQTVKAYCEVFDESDVYSVYELVLRGKSGEEAR